MHGAPVPSLELAPTPCTESCARRRSVPTWLLCALAALSYPSVGCPAPDPPKAPVAIATPTEADAKDALARAKKSGDPDALIAVFNKYPQQAAGKTALRLGVRKLLERALEAAEACDEPAAAGALAKVAPYTSDDREIDEAYDDTHTAVGREHKRCLLVKLDKDVKRAEADWDFARAFSRIQGEKDAEGGALKKRRIELTDRWRKWLDTTLALIAAKKGFAAALGDKREAFDASIDPSQLPGELAPDLEKRLPIVQGLRLVFEKLEGGQLIEPPLRYWVYGSAKARRVDSPSSPEGTVLSNGVTFHAIAKGKVSGVLLLAVGSNEGDLLARLASIKLLVLESDARTWDTRVSLPEKLVGARVLAPIANGSDVLAPATVLAELPNGVYSVQGLGKKGPKVFAKRKELRGLAMGPGQKVQVMIGGQAKPAELADAPEEERVLVKISGFESYVPLGDVRIKRSDLPPLPAD